MSDRHTEYAHIPSLAARALARAVIGQAVADALDPATPDKVRADAREFLAGDDRYRAWCLLAEMRPVPLVPRRAA